jgi:Recombination endonuclease VII
MQVVHGSPSQAVVPTESSAPDRTRQGVAVGESRGLKAWREKNRDRRLEQLREIHLRNKFGLTPVEYDRILETQGGVCALCGCPPTPGISLHVDHDHGTGEIRGLLCVRCDNALGLFREDPDLLKRAARYVTVDAKHRSQRTKWERVACERAHALRGSAA